jgi:hypothetical protein
VEKRDMTGARFEVRTPVAVAMIQPAFAFDGNDLVASLESPKTLKSDLNGSAGTGSITDNTASSMRTKGIGRIGGTRTSAGAALAVIAVSKLQFATNYATLQLVDSSN